MDNLTALAARDDLLAIVAAWDALNARLVPSGSTTRNGARPAPGSRPPINVHVSDLIHEITQAAEFYGQVLMEETDDWQPTTSTMPGLLSEVAHRYGHFTHGDDEKTGYDFTDTAHELRRKVTHTLEQPEPPRWMGPCVVAECDGELRLHAGKAYTRCPECGNVAGMLELHEHLNAAFEGRLMTRWEIVSALHVLEINVKPKTVEKWIERWQNWKREIDAGGNRKRPTQCLEPAHVNPDLYRFRDAKEVAERSTARQVAA